MLKPFVESEQLLNIVGNLFLSRGKIKEALGIYKINYILYPELGIAIAGLGKGFLRSGEVKAAIEYLEYTLQINKKPGNVKEILQVLYETKDAERAR